ncbi:MAG: type-F conjugative transfer system secretin TraK [Rubrivivax sp.]|nr:type-F conjugative transfer system secretin TraK [Rubrivivax sp.]
MLLLAEPAAALQIVDARDGDTALAKVSRQEVTRIAFERGRIRRITGNTGEFVLEKDDEQGQLFVRPIDPASTKPINLFLSTDKSTVALLLQPVDMPSDSIVIRQARAASDAPPRLESASRHVRMVKNLLLALAQDALPEDMEVREVARELLLWPDTRQHPAGTGGVRPLQTRRHGREHRAAHAGQRRVNTRLRHTGASQR